MAVAWAAHFLGREICVVVPVVFVPKRGPTLATKGKA
jgi:hypothetical protein